MTIPTESFNIGDEFALTKDGQIKIITLTRKTNTMLIMDNNTRWQYRSYARAGCEFRCHGVNHQYEVGFLAVCNHQHKYIAKKQELARLIKAQPLWDLHTVTLTKIIKIIGAD